MLYQRIILYGTPAAQERAKNLLQNLEEIKQLDFLRGGLEIKLSLQRPLKETSLIPLLRSSGIH